MNDEFCSSCGRLEKECICNSKEFCLSEFVEDDDDIEDGKISTVKVREFIRLLKEEYVVSRTCNCIAAEKFKCRDCVFLEWLDKLAGSKLL